MSLLTQTFAHLPGIGEQTERGLWEKGIQCWDDLACVDHSLLPARLRLGKWRDPLEVTQREYERKAWRYFDEQIPGALKWRAFEELAADACYVDIETSGYDNRITVIGVYQHGAYHSFVAGINLDKAREWIEAAPLVITFNGASFDMPIIRSHFPYNVFNHIHIDLMFPLRRLGMKGGLKQIERRLGLARSDETSQMNGWDAVLLWQQYRRGHAGALERLLVYNEEDVRNLEPLMQWTFSRMTGEQPGG
jgi:hypothetical protein